MNKGFAHFDGCFRENFIAGMLLLLLEMDERFRDRFVRVVRTRAGLPPGERLLELDREKWMKADEDGRRQRGDLWLRFADGVVLVELKTHGRWDRESVAAQVKRQESGEFGGLPAKPLAVVLVGPRAIGLPNRCHFLSWGEVIRELRASGPPSAIGLVVAKHLEDHVERDIGFAEGGMVDIKQTARNVAVLKAFLHSCVLGIDGRLETESALWTTFGDGEPRRGGGWAWYGLSVPFRLRNEQFRVGVYHYAETPTGREDCMAHPWLEMYRMRDDELCVELPFPSTLDPAALDELRESFRKAWGGWQR